MGKSFLKHPIIIILRWLLFIPFELIVIGFITNIVFIIIGWIISLGLGWFIAFLLFGSFLYNIIGMLILGIVAFTVNFCPKVKVGSVTIILIATSNCVYSLINIWKFFENSGTIEVFFLISFTIIHLYLLWYIFIGSVTQLTDDY